MKELLSLKLKTTARNIKVLTYCLFLFLSDKRSFTKQQKRLRDKKKRNLTMVKKSSIREAPWFTIN